jgi:regulator of protease activity HflC (stomatin/prohibitin superfamily)
MSPLLIGVGVTIGLVSFVAVGVLLAAFVSAIRILGADERGVLFRLGRFAGCRGPGWLLVVPGIDRLVRVSLRSESRGLAAQPAVTRDGIPVAVDAVAEFEVVDPVLAAVATESYVYRTVQLARDAIRDKVEQIDLGELVDEQGKVGTEVQQEVELTARAWGVRISRVELLDVHISEVAAAQPLAL